MKIFPVFHNSLLRPKTNGQGLKGQDLINEAESADAFLNGTMRQRKSLRNGSSRPSLTATMKPGYTTSSNGGTTSQHGSPLPI